MGEIRITCDVSNSKNGQASSRRSGKSGMKHMTIDALVDTGAVEVLLPAGMVRLLELDVFDKSPVTLADDRTVTMPVAGPLWITAFGRRMVTDCLVGPDSCEPLIGQIVMERLDLVLDPKRRTIKPRLKSGPVLKLKRRRGQ